MPGRPRCLHLVVDIDGQVAEARPAPGGEERPRELDEQRVALFGRLHDETHAPVGAERREDLSLGAEGRALHVWHLRDAFEREGKLPETSRRHACFTRQHFLCFLPLPQGHGSFRPTFGVMFTT